MSTQTSDLGMVSVVDNVTGEVFEVLRCMLRDTLRIKTRSGKPRYSKCSNTKVYGK